MTVKIPAKVESRIDAVMQSYRHGSRFDTRQMILNLSRLELAYLMMYQHQVENGMIFDADGIEDFARFVINSLHHR